MLIPEAIFTVIGKTMVSPTAQVEELNEPMVVVMVVCAKSKLLKGNQAKVKQTKNFKRFFIIVYQKSKLWLFFDKPHYAVSIIPLNAQEIKPRGNRFEIEFMAE